MESPSDPSFRELFRSLSGLSGLGASTASGGRVALLGAVSASSRVALLSAGTAGSSLGGSGSLRSSALSSSLLVVVSTAAYHSNGGQNDDKREDLFHSVKRFNY